MASYPVINTPTLPTVAGKTITNVDSNGLNPIANMVIKMLEKCDNEFADALSASQSTSYYNMAIPYGFVASEYDNNVYFGYDYESLTRPLQVNIRTNRFIREMRDVRFIEYRDGDVVTLEPQSQQDSGQALASPLYTGTELFYYNFSATEEDVTPFFAEPYSSTQRNPKLYRGQPGSRTLVNSSIRSMYLILKFRGFKTCHIMDGEYTHTPTLIDGDVYLYVNIPSLFYRLGGAVYNYMDDPEITKSFFDNDIKVICSVPPAVTYPQILTPPRMIKADLDKLFNTIAIPFTYDPAQVQNETFSDGYDPNFVYVEKTDTSPGQGNNTTSDWTGAGDNTEDSLIFDSPNFSPMQEAVNQYALNSLQVQSFAHYLFTADVFNDFDLLQNDPREGLVSCKYFPFEIRGHDPSHIGDLEEIVIGGVQMDNVSAARILSGYNQILDLGEFDVMEYFGGFLDYQLTSIDIYLPYVGWQQLNSSAIMNRKLKIKYVVDLNSGDCACLILSTDGKVDRFENVFTGQMGIDIPILTSNHNENVKQAGSTILSAGVAVGGAIATFASGGSLAPVALAGAGATIANSASSVATMMNHQKLGTPVGSSLSMWMPQDIIFRITRPTKSEASEFKNRRGYRSNYSTQLKNVTGFVQIDDPFLDGLSLHEGEKEQLAQILKGGIFI